MSKAGRKETSIVRPALAGAIALSVLLVGAVAWGFTAPLSSAVIAQGKIVAEGRNKIVQHFEGGIIREILVEEGETVEAGQLLLRLDATAAEVSRNRLQSQLLQVQAIEDRALAELTEQEKIEFSAQLRERASRNPAVAAIVKDQRAEFTARLERFQAEQAILRRQIDALEEEIVGLEAQKQSVALQLQLIREQKLDAEKLLEENLYRKSTVLEIKRAEADLIGKEGQLTAQIAKARQAIAEAEQQAQKLRATRQENASALLSEQRARRADLLEQMRSAEDILNRVAIRSPAAGTVLNLLKTGAGAVTQPGETLMEIVPEGVELVVEARVRPIDVDEVRIGQEARLVFSALNSRDIPPVRGEVIHLSADRMTEDRSGEDYYLARLSIDADSVADFDLEAIGPGQPVETFITTGERTMAAYLVEPLASTLRRSMREK